MNRVIIIGNGFDKAHGLATGYKDFIDSYWDKVSHHIFNDEKRLYKERSGNILPPNTYDDRLISFEILDYRTNKKSSPSYPKSCSSPYDDVQKLIAMFNDYREGYRGSVQLKFKNEFFEHVSGRCSLTNWVDIENEYYENLKELLQENDTLIREEKVQKLNQDFDIVKEELEKYLTKIVEEAKPTRFGSIQKAFDSVIEPDEIAYIKQRSVYDLIIQEVEKSNLKEEEQYKTALYLNKTKGIPLQLYPINDQNFRTRHFTPKQTLVLNFNYTRTAEKKYNGSGYEVINIHGQLNDENNPIIFGYGDELDDDYKRIEKLQDNDFLENIKSIRYHETSNYRKLLSFIEAKPYQVITMGHSCGNSDRTLLNASSI
ncbi:AbiH family protein [Porphyromonas sp.]|uniref:AbiH family protein n=1 Tax=Porphyromonas sp. TaxID=1924944 RepID=UPI0026DA844F|nr:AbiH family protein [Porphyromonas sp.]MDO4771158.1 AbiH family protein [Porphyromonas sp.]